MPWVDSQSYPYGPVERVWEEGWTEQEMAPYAGKTRVYEDSPGHYLIPVYGQDFSGRKIVERFIGD